ncbi:MAG: hypothetical protein J7K47_03595 [Thermoplasmata archaeon]|nr:hypothetical protein [Thermoplasmata archaeon]
MITFRRWLWQKFKNAIIGSISFLPKIIKSTYWWGLFLVILAFIVVTMKLSPFPDFLSLVLIISGEAIIVLSWFYEEYKEEVKRVRR